MQRPNKKTVLASVVLSAVLAACGGGGGGDSDEDVASSTVVEGAYAGSLSGAGANNTFNALILENGEVWSMYGRPMSSGVFAITGFVQGNGSSSNGSYSSSAAQDFGLSPAMPGSVTAYYDTQAKTINGRFSFGANTTLFSGSAITSQYTYDTAASIASVVGNWSLNALSGEGIALSVSAIGAVTAVSSLGCSMTGSLTPRPSGKNVFNVSLRFGPAPCALPNQAVTGIALTYGLGNGSQQLIVAGFDGSRQYGTAAVGTR